MKAKRKSGAAKRKLKFPAQAAMLRAAKRAREVARRHGTPIYFMRDGKIVAEKP